MSSDDPVQALARKLGREWGAVTTAAKASVDRMNLLDSVLRKYTTEDTSIVIFGSLARRELTSGSDLDWVLLVDGIADPEHLGAALSIESTLDEEAVKKPGAEATFGGLVFSHDLINIIGGVGDSNANLTRRMLLLLESSCIGRDEAYGRVIRNVLRRYIQEDFGWMNARNPRNVPRFLQNDMARYWRTLAVDFAYKRRQRGGRGWALRTAKLRLSRKLTYASGLLMCFSCATDPTGTAISVESDPDSAALAIVGRLSDLVKSTPLQLFARLFLDHGGLDGAAAEMFDAYNEFLSILDDDEKRKHLDDLGQADVATDRVYNTTRELGHRFQRALDSVFFDPGGCPELYELTKTYGVF